MKVKAKDFMIFMSAVAIFYGFIFALGFTCPIKALTGVSTPGCGMTRAWFSLLRLRPRTAFYYHPLFPLPAIVFLAFIFRDRLSDNFKKYGLALVIILFFLVYAWRMMDPNNTIVVFRPHDSIVYRAYIALGRN